MNAPIEQRHLDRATELRRDYPLRTDDALLVQLIANADAAAREWRNVGPDGYAKINSLICPDKPKETEK